MQLRINGESYEIAESDVALLLQQFQSTGLEMYHKQDDWLRFALKPVARWMLDKWEGKLAVFLGRERAAQICRPPRKRDPVQYLGELGMLQFQAMVKYAEISIETQDGRATSFNVSFIAAPEDQAGRSLDLDRNVREWQNDGAEISGRDVQQAFSDSPALRAGL